MSHPTGWAHDHGLTDVGAMVKIKVKNYIVSFQFYISCFGISLAILTGRSNNFLKLLV